MATGSSEMETRHQNLCRAYERARFVAHDRESDRARMAHEAHGQKPGSYWAGETARRLKVAEGKLAVAMAEQEAAWQSLRASSVALGYIKEEG